MLAELMKDPYAAVRWVAYDSLRKDERFRKLNYDFDGAVEDREAAANQAIKIWSLNRSTLRREQVLLTEQGEPNVSSLETENPAGPGEKPKKTSRWSKVRRRTAWILWSFLPGAWPFLSPSIWWYGLVHLQILVGPSSLALLLTPGNFRLDQW